METLAPLRAAAVRTAATALCDRLQDAIDRMQAAERGTAELDALLQAVIAQAFAGAMPVAMRDLRRPASGGRWATDLTEALALLPPRHNWSLGRRDGVCWAWIQPNDKWEPGEFESRHDHPQGSGLLVARTEALALTCAAASLYIRLMSLPEGQATAGS